MIGYVIHPDNTLEAASASDFELYKMGEDENPPTDFEFNFTAGMDY